MKYTQEFREKLELAVYSKAEQLATEVDSDGLTDYNMQVEVDRELFDFKVDCTVSNYDHDAETNAASFNVEIFCTNIFHTSKVMSDYPLKKFMMERFYLETLYKD